MFKVYQNTTYTILAEHPSYLHLLLVIGLKKSQDIKNSHIRRIAGNTQIDKIMVHSASHLNRDKIECYLSLPRI